MFRVLANRALLRIRVSTITPLSIRAGDTGLEPGGSDIKCVRMHCADGSRSVYIPGSSFKGVIRSTAESMLRGKKFCGAKGACDPIDSQSSCGETIDSRGDSARVHSNHCLMCRLFGSKSIKGRAAIRDLMPWSQDQNGQEIDERQKTNRTQIRFGVAINRVSGAASRGKLFDQEIVPPGANFWGEIAFENYQVWQLGIFAAVFHELNDGYAQLGSSKTRGLGVVQVTVESMAHEQPLYAGKRPAGAGRIAAAQARVLGLLNEPELPSIPEKTCGLMNRFELNSDQAMEWLNIGLNALGAL